MENTHPVDSVEYNKAFVIAHFEEFVNRKNTAIAFTNLSEDFLDHDEAGGPAIGPLKAKEMMDGAQRMMPDLHVQVEEILAEGDKVMVRNIWSATRPDGVKIQMKGFVLWRLKAGKIVERWATITPLYPIQGDVPGW